MSKKQKTNAMRILDKAGIKYRTIEYEYDENDLSGYTVAEKVGMFPECVFKTIVLRGERKGIIVCCIPVSSEINLKALASCAGDKKVDIVHLKELLPLTGYIRGGCSPIGMKKNYPVFIEQSAFTFDEIAVSAGIRGCQIVISPKDLIDFLNCGVFVNN